MKQGKWNEEEVNFLKFAYPSKDFTVAEICLALDRKKYSVLAKASQLNLKRYKEDLPEGFKRCSMCGTIQSIQFFRFKKHEGAYDSWCKECSKEYNRKRWRLANNKNENGEPINAQKEKPLEEKICTICKKTKPISHFSRDRTAKGGYDHRCKECKKAQTRKYLLKKYKERGWGY